MGVLQGVGQLGHQVHCLGYKEGVVLSFPQVRFEGRALDEGHHQVVEVPLTPVIQNVHDAGVVQAGGAGFALEASRKLGVGGEVGGRNLRRMVKSQPSRLVKEKHGTMPVYEQIQ